MESTYQLLGVERGVPEVYNSTYDIRFMLHATKILADGDELHVPGGHFVESHLVNRFDKTEIGQLLTDFGLVPELGGTHAHDRRDDAIA